MKNLSWQIFQPFTSFNGAGFKWRVVLINSHTFLISWEFRYFHGLNRSFFGEVDPSFLMMLVVATVGLMVWSEKWVEVIRILLTLLIRAEGHEKIWWEAEMSLPIQLSDWREELVFMLLIVINRTYPILSWRLWIKQNGFAALSEVVLHQINFNTLTALPRKALSICLVNPFSKMRV